MTPLEFLQRDEWSMGNGQCPECYGNAANFCYGTWGGWMEESEIGHKADCALAQSIEALGGTCTRKGTYTAPDRDAYERSKKERTDFWHKIWERGLDNLAQRMLAELKDE